MFSKKYKINLTLKYDLLWDYRDIFRAQFPERDSYKTISLYKSNCKKRK